MAEREGDALSPSSIPSGEQTVWADVSSLLESACTDLQDGELIHGENFSLFAAMSALEGSLAAARSSLIGRPIEIKKVGTRDVFACDETGKLIMDPKMDSGVKKCGYNSVEEAIANDAAPVPLSFDKTIDVQRIIDVMDHLLACEATWHNGHSLAQTVFSCIYLLRLERTSSHALLHSYCRIIRATCNSVISAVSDARTHEEEDFFTMAYGLHLKGEGDDKCLSILNAVEETISRQLRACKASLSKKRVSEDIEPLQTNPDLEEGYCKALLCRIRFRKHFYHVLMCMRKSHGRGLELARKHIASSLSELACIRNSFEFLRSTVYVTGQDDSEDSTTASGSQPVGFDASLNSRLFAPIPPRSIKFLSWKKALKYFEKLLHDLDIICSFSLDQSLEAILRFVAQFQKLQPDLVARAHLQLLLVRDGKLYGRDPIVDVISRAAKLPEVTRNHDVKKNEFVVQLGQLVINLLKVLCTNAAWQRRKLGKILQDWSVTSVQLELAFKREFGEVQNISADENVYMKLSKNLLVWTEEQSFWIASRFLMLGFELELYSPSDYCMVYWYMYVIFIKLSEKAQLKMVTGSSDAVSRKGKKKRDQVKDVIREPQIPPSMLLLQCYICLAEGLTMMLAALRNESNIFQTSGVFNTEQERFIQHFDFLQRARIPANISYLMFTESTIHVHFMTLVKYNYFRDAQRIAKELRSSFSSDPDRLAELKQIEKVAEYNWVALNVICQAGPSDPCLKVSFEFNHHPCFAVAVVKRS